MIKFFQWVDPAQRAPAFYGAVKQDFRTGRFLICPIPFNLVFSVCGRFGAWLVFGLRGVPMAPHAAYAEGRRDGMEEAYLDTTGGRRALVVGLMDAIDEWQIAHATGNEDLVHDKAEAVLRARTRLKLQMGLKP